MGAAARKIIIWCIFSLNVHLSQKVPEYLERQVQPNPVILLTQVPPCSHVASVQWSTNVLQVLPVYPSLHIHVKPVIVFTHLWSPHGFSEHGSRSTNSWIGKPFNYQKHNAYIYHIHIRSHFLVCVTLLILFLAKDQHINCGCVMI